MVVKGINSYLKSVAEPCRGLSSPSNHPSHYTTIPLTTFRP